MSQAMLHFDNMEDVRERLENAVTQSSVETSYDGEDCFITVTQKNYETGNKNEWSFCVDFDTQKVIMLEPMEDTEGFSNDNEVFEIIKNFLNGGSSREKRMMYSSKQIKSSYKSWDDFYDKGCKLGLQTYMNALDDIHDKYGKFENVPKDKLSELIMSIPEDSEERHHFLDDMIDYFDFSSILSSKQIKSALWDHNKAAVDEIMKYCDDLHLPCGVAGNTFTVAKDFIQGPYKNIDFESVEQVKKEIDNFVKSSKQIKSSNDAKKLFEDEDIKDLIYEWSMYGESKSVRNILKEIDFDNPDTEKFIKFFKAVKKYSTEDELPIIEKALKLLGSSKQITSSVDELTNNDITEGMRVTWGGDEKGKVITWNDNDVLIENLGGMKDFIIGHNYKLTGNAKEPKLGWGHGDYGYRDKDEALKAFKKIKSSKVIKSGLINTLTFEQIVDSRFDDISKGEEILNQRRNKIISLCGNDFTVLTDDIRFLDWGNGESQYRQKYYIKKNSNNKSWNDLYKIVNSVCPVPYKFKKMTESLFSSYKSSKVIKSDRLPNEPTEKDYKIFVDLLNDYCEKHYGDYSGLYSFEYQPDEKYGSFIIVDNEGNLNIHSDDELTKYIRSKLSEKGWYPEAVYSESDFCIATM